MKTYRAVFAGLCLAAAAMLVAPAAATAAPASDAASVSSGLVPVYDAHHKSARLVSPATAATIIRDYWTADRLTAATPVAAASGAADTGRLHPQPTGPERTLAQPALA